VPKHESYVNNRNAEYRVLQTSFWTFCNRLFLRIGKHFVGPGLRWYVLSNLYQIQTHNHAMVGDHIIFSRFWHFFSERVLFVCVLAALQFGRFLFSIFLRVSM